MMVSDNNCMLVSDNNCMMVSDNNCIMVGATCSIVFKLYTPNFNISLRNWQSQPVNTTTVYFVTQVFASPWVSHFLLRSEKKDLYSARFPHMYSAHAASASSTFYYLTVKPYFYAV
jgi:hypothetical protein